MKLCKNCKHCEPYDRLKGLEMYYAECIRPMKEKNVVSGEFKLQPYTYCSTLRNGGFIIARMFNVCGKEGRFFEKKS